MRQWSLIELNLKQWQYYEPIMKPRQQMIFAIRALESLRPCFEAELRINDKGVFTLNIHPLL
jgi:hypothetical protein